MIGFSTFTTFVRIALFAITVGSIRGHIRSHIILANNNTSDISRILHHDQWTSLVVSEASIFALVARILALKYVLGKTAYKNLNKFND